MIKTPGEGILAYFVVRERANGIFSKTLRNYGYRLDLCLFVPCFPAFFDLLISLGQ